MKNISGTHSYRDFIDPDAPMYRSDIDLLSTLKEQGYGTPHQLAKGRYRENVIRLQLRDLEQIGALSQIGLETYRLTSTGEKLIREASDHFENGILEVEAYAPELFPPDDWRLHNFSWIDASVLKRLNMEFYTGLSTYGDVRKNDPGLTKRRISNVPDTDIHRIIREFPTTAPLPEACAHWMRAIVGLHLFPDANHRTATNSLEYLVEQAGGPSDRIITERIPRWVLHSKYTRTFQSDVRFNTLWAKDELFAVWYRYFTSHLSPGLEVRRPHDPPTEELDRILELCRSELTDVTNK